MKLVTVLEARVGYQWTVDTKNGSHKGYDKAGYDHDTDCWVFMDSLNHVTLTVNSENMLPFYHVRM